MAAESSLEEAQARSALAAAEQRFLAGDVAGARRYAQHALNLAPGLHGAEQALVAYDVHAAAPDWYAVLSLGRQLPHPRPPGGALPGGITHDDIKRQHRRLCLLVHPDKNPFAAADGAFKIVQAAYADAMRGAASAARTAREEEEAARSRFWQTVADDVIIPPAPMQPPIARPPPRWAAPAPGPPRQKPAQPPNWAQGQRTPAPSNFYATQPTMPGKKPHCPLYPFCRCCRII